MGGEIGDSGGGKREVERGDAEGDHCRTGQPEEHWKENFWKDEMAHEKKSQTHAPVLQWPTPKLPDLRRAFELKISAT